MDQYNGRPGGGVLCCFCGLAYPLLLHSLFRTVLLLGLQSSSASGAGNVQVVGMVTAFESSLDKQMDSSAASHPLFPLSDQALRSKGYLDQHIPGSLRNTSQGYFAHFSTYRANLSRFVAMGLALPGISKESISCTWHSKGTAPASSCTLSPQGDTPGNASGAAHPSTSCPVQGRISLDFAEQLGAKYVYMAIYCDLLPFASQSMDFPEQQAAGQGVLKMSVGGDALADYIQEKETSVHTEGSRGPFPLNLVMCSMPLFGSVEPQGIVQWGLYNFFQGFDGLALYDAGALSTDEAASNRAMLQAHLGCTTHTILSFTQQEQYPSWYHGQFLAMNDCMYRARDQAAWVAFSDLDEYVAVDSTPPPHPQNAAAAGLRLTGHMTPLKSLLVSMGDKAWLSLGSVPFIRYCPGKNWSLSDWDPQQGVWAVELALHRKADPECWSDKEKPTLCWGSVGRRKMYVNPRKVEMTWVHVVHRLEWPASEAEWQTQGVVLEVGKQMHLAHFRGLASFAGWCQPKSDSLGGSLVSQQVAHVAQQARKATQGHPAPECIQISQSHTKT